MRDRERLLNGCVSAHNPLNPTPVRGAILRDLGRYGLRRMVIARVRGRRTLVYLHDTPPPGGPVASAGGGLLAREAGFPDLADAGVRTSRTG